MVVFWFRRLCMAILPHPGAIDSADFFVFQILAKAGQTHGFPPMAIY
jgi:hypothetical protein